MTRVQTSDRKAELRQRQVLVRMLTGGRAHAELAETLARFPKSLCAAQPRGAPYTPWELLEHLRLAQEDILRFSLDPEHESPPWPSGYWPSSSAPPDVRAWEKSVKAFLRDLRALTALAKDARRDLLAPIPGTSTTLFGQLALAASHNSYHLGQLVLLRRMLAARGRKRNQAG